MTARASRVSRSRRSPSPARPDKRPTPSSDPVQLQVVDLFCGAGGLSEGFRSQGYQIIAGNDHDPDAVATFQLNFPEAAALRGDIRNRELREHLDAVASTADVIVGGPPCQAFSQVRSHTRLIDDPRNSLYREFVASVKSALPDAFLMENVPGLAQMGVKEQVVRDLELDGEYDVMPQLVDAADFGVPQTRKRLLFLGVRRSLGVPPPTLRGSGATEILHLRRLISKSGSAEYAVAAGLDARGEELLEALADPNNVTVVSASQAIGDLAGLEGGRRADQIRLKELPPPASAYQRQMRAGRRAELANVSVPRCRQDTVLRLEGIPLGGNYRDLAEHLRARYLTGAKWGPHNGSGQLGRHHFYAYRRLHPDMWAWTLNTKGDSVYHYATPRSLSVREFARLQSFSDSFRVSTDARRGDLPGRLSGGATHSRYRQVGNAVPPLLAAAAASALRQTIFDARLNPRKTA